LIMPARVDIDVRLPQQQIQTKDLLALQSGDILTLDMPINSPVDFILNGKTYFRGSVVRAGKKRAFRIAGGLN